MEVGTLLRQYRIHVEGYTLVGFYVDFSDHCIILNHLTFFIDIL